MLIFGLNLSSRRKKRFPGIDDVIVARPCHWSTSADRFVDMTLKEVLSDPTPKGTFIYYVRIFQPMLNPPSPPCQNSRESKNYGPPPIVRIQEGPP